MSATCGYQSSYSSRAAETAFRTLIASGSRRWLEVLLIKGHSALHFTIGERARADIAGSRGSFVMEKGGICSDYKLYCSSKL